MTDSNVDKMRSVLIYTPDGVSAEEALKRVDGWFFEELNIPGGHKFCLSNGDTKIALAKRAENVVVTSNVLPHDWNHEQDKANDALLQLKLALDKSDISSVVVASNIDLGTFTQS